MMKVLVDNSVRADAQVGRFLGEPSTVEWGGTKVTVDVTKFRIDLPSDPVKRQHILRLPTISRLACEGTLQLVTYSELKWEDMFGTRPARATRGDLLGAVEFHEVEAAIDRSYFGGLLFSRDFKGDALTSFCKLILRAGFELARLPDSLISKLPEVTRKGIVNVDRFRSICRHAPEKHYRDLFHLWTGECNECRFFLTMESRLPNFCSSHVKDIACKPVNPTDLLNQLGIDQVDPLPFPQGESVNYFDAVAD